jgi:hypothetical protein
LHTHEEGETCHYRELRGRKWGASLEILISREDRRTLYLHQG